MLKTFRIGGIHPPENKLTADRPIEQSPLPKQAVILLSQHIGTPAQPVVAKGDRVKVGTLIAKASGFVLQYSTKLSRVMKGESKNDEFL